MLTLSPLIDFPLIRQGDNLADILVDSLTKTVIEIQDGDILVLAQKIVSKAEGRIVDLKSITPSENAQELAIKTEKDPRVVELILRESNEILRTRPGAIIVEHRLGFVCANAGIDHSNVYPETSEASKDLGGLNAEDWVLLLPEDPDGSADQIRQEIKATRRCGKRRDGGVAELQEDDKLVVCATQR